MPMNLSMISFDYWQDRVSFVMILDANDSHYSVRIRDTSRLVVLVRTLFIGIWYSRIRFGILSARILITSVQVLFVATTTPIDWK